MHKLFVNTYLFLITPTCISAEISSSGSCSYATLQANWM